MRKIVILFIFIAILTSGCSKGGSEIILEDSADETAFLISDDMERAVDFASVDISSETSSDSDIEETVTVYVCGAVKAPGVYELSSDERLIAAVEAAGGFLPEADTIYVNLAARLQDGMKLKIPTLSETAQMDEGDLQSYDESEDNADNKNGGAAALVNINTADRDMLKTLPGIGDGIAGRIIEYREQNGRFKKPEDIMNVTGIKSKLFSKFKDHITV